MNYYFRAWALLWGGYNGIGGNAYDCGELDNNTCLIKMHDYDNIGSYNILWINDEHTLATTYSCSEMMWGLFSY